jgi:hypothetical protein
MHEYMGRRVSGCGGGSLPAGFGQMMSGVNGMMGMMGGTGGGSGMMGGQGGSGGSGGMMGGFDGGNQAGDDDNDVPGWAIGGMIALMALFLAGFYFLLRGVRGRPAGDGPAEILKRRLAAGEINQDDYERRIALIGGGK